jgi:carboxylesterase
MAQRHVPATPAARGARRAALLGAAAGAIIGTVVGVLALGKVAGIGFAEVAGAVAYWTAAGALLALLTRAVARLGRPRWLWRLLAVIAGLAGFWVLGDLANALLLRRCYANWEAGVQRDADGVRAGCEERQYGTGETALLLVHGFADSPAIYEQLAAALAKKGYACYTHRLPHFAEPFDRYAASSAAGWRASVADRLRQLREKHRRVVVVAHSLGGAVTVDYLIDHPEAVDGVVLLAPLIAVSNQRSPLLTAEAWFHVLDHTLIFSDRVAMLLPPDVRDPHALEKMKEDRFIPRTIYREMFKLIDRNRERGARFSSPLLLVLARSDQVIDSPSAERFFNECASTRKRIEWRDQAGHVLPIDYGWKQLVDDIDRFASEQEV